MSERRVGIFDGADERYEAFKAQGKKRKTKRAMKAKVSCATRRVSVASKCYYGFQGLSLKTLLELDMAPSHQQCLRDGLLVDWSEAYAGRTLFVSHEWTSFELADHSGAQLKVLQQVLRRLMLGQVAEVVTDGLSGVVGNGFRFHVTGAEWKAALGHGDAFVFFDYWSIPQPTAGPMPVSEMEEEHIELAMVDTTDHRVGTSHVVHCLQNAVQSLPSYIERSDLVLVLCPPVMHKNRGGVCDFASWRSRGWCRLEAVSAVLAKTQPKLMVVKGTSDPDLQFMNLDKALGSPVGDGCFTCCQLQHKSSRGGIVACDKSKIAPVLEVLLDAKLMMLQEQRQSLVEYRCFAVTRAMALKGLPAATKGASNGLAALKAGLRWGEGEGGDDEAAITQRTGIGLLMWAVMAGDAEAVQELLQAGGEGVDTVNLRIKVDRADLGLKKGYSPVLMAMHTPSTSFDIVALLLDAGADPYTLQKLSTGTVSPLCAAAKGGDNPPEKVTRWMERYPQYDADCGSQPPLVYAAIHGRCAAFLRALVDAGCDPARCDPAQGGTPLICAVADTTGFPAADAESLAYLLSLPAVRATIDARARPRWRLFRAVFSAARVLARLGLRGSRIDVAAMAEGTTALHAAAMFSNEAGVRQLLAAGADPRVKNAMGMTGMEAAQWCLGGQLPPLLARALSEADAGQGATKGARPMIWAVHWMMIHVLVVTGVWFGACLGCDIATVLLVVGSLFLGTVVYSHKIPTLRY